MCLHVSVCYSYALVCTRMYSYVLVCYSNVFVCHSYVLVCTRMYPYVTRMYERGVLVMIVCDRLIFSKHFRSGNRPIFIIWQGSLEVNPS